MAKWTYHCLTCDWDWTYEGSIAVYKAVQQCPTCGTQSTRVMDTPSVVFKGPGFYSTDSRNEAKSG